MAARTVTVILDAGTPTLGLWCLDCMTSGGFTLPLYRLCRHGVTRLATATGCLTCGGPGRLET